MNQVFANVSQAPPRLIRGPEIGLLDKMRILGSNRSWWQVRYASGKVVSEWQTLQLVKSFLPIGSNKSSRWEEILKFGIRGLYLLCPNGMVGALEADGEYQFFQLKVGGVGIGLGQYCDAHIIGKVDDDNGNCVLWAWEYREQQLKRFEDNVTNLRYCNIGALSLGHHTGVI